MSAKGSKTYVLFAIILLISIIPQGCRKDTIKALNNGDISYAVTPGSPYSGMILTRSAYKTSFLEKAGQDAEVIYLGKPRDLGITDPADYSWHSSDESVAVVHNGIVTGLKEGLVGITQKQGDKTVSERTFAVTTFNDGRQAELSYSLGKEKIADMLSPENGIPSPDYLKQNINTLQDAITYFQLRGFEKADNIPVLCNTVSDWIWFAPGDLVLTENAGYSEDIATAAAYLLSDDFEDHGFIYAFKAAYSTINWFYEDGYYYAFNFAELLQDLDEGFPDNSYDIFRTDDPEALKQYVLDITGASATMAVVMISTSGRNFRPPMRLSFLHDSSAIYHEHVEIALEDAVYDRSAILFINPDFDLDIVSIPSSEIPEGIPRFGPETGYDY